MLLSEPCSVGLRPASCTNLHCSTRPRLHAAHHALITHEKLGDGVPTPQRVDQRLVATRRRIDARIFQHGTHHVAVARAARSEEELMVVGRGIVVTLEQPAHHVDMFDGNVRRDRCRVDAHGVDQFDVGQPMKEALVTVLTIVCRIVAVRNDRRTTHGASANSNRRVGHELLHRLARRLIRVDHAIQVLGGVRIRARLGRLGRLAGERRVETAQPRRHVRRRVPDGGARRTELLAFRRAQDDRDPGLGNGGSVLTRRSVAHEHDDTDLRVLEHVGPLLGLAHVCGGADDQLDHVGPVAHHVARQRSVQLVVKDEVEHGCRKPNAAIVERAGVFEDAVNRVVVRDVCVAAQAVAASEHHEQLHAGCAALVEPLFWFGWFDAVQHNLKLNSSALCNASLGF